MAKTPNSGLQINRSQTKGGRHRGYIHFYYTVYAGNLFPTSAVNKAVSSRAKKFEEVWRS